MSLDENRESEAAVGAAIKKARQLAGLTLADLSRETGIIISTLSRFERGVLGYQPSLRQIARITKAFDRLGVPHTIKTSHTPFTNRVLEVTEIVTTFLEKEGVSASNHQLVVLVVALLKFDELDQRVLPALVRLAKQAGESGRLLSIETITAVYQDLAQTVSTPCPDRV